MNRKQEGPYMVTRGRETQDMGTQVWHQLGIMLQNKSVTIIITNNMCMWSSFKPASVWWGQQWPQCCYGSLLKSPIAGRQNSHYCPKAATEHTCHHWDVCSPTKWIAPGSYNKPARANISPFCQTAAIILWRVECSVGILKLLNLNLQTFRMAHFQVCYSSQ